MAEPNKYPVPTGEDVRSREVLLIGQPETPRVFIKLCLNGRTLKGLLDSGCPRNLIHESLLYRHFGETPVLGESIVKVRGVGDDQMVESLGTVSGRVSVSSVYLEDTCFSVWWKK